MRLCLTKAHQEIARSQVEKQAIEEKMRRTLLQGMTAMNMETLQLFNEFFPLKKGNEPTT